ncbi:MAG: hypothetical protein JXB50_05750 [Spirochaetes bacterium]|nr:hypothetical protein [Spirochaetota bacterium]
MKLFYCILFCLITFYSYSNKIIKKFEEFDKRGKYNEALDYLLKEIDKPDADIGLRWRIAMTTFEITNNISNNKEKIKYFDIGIKVTKDYLDIENINKRDRAEIIHWYMINYASKLKVLGIFAGRESMTIIPEIIKNMDKCIEIDPEYAGSYFFKGKLYIDIPHFLGGDKFKMGVNLIKAINYADDNQMIPLYTGSAECFIIRNWSVEKKKNLKDKKNNPISDGTPLELSDIEYARLLLNKVINIYNEKNDPSVRETENYNKAIYLLNKIK